MMEAVVAAALVILAGLSLGAVGAGVNGPICCDWPARSGVMKRRLRALTERLPSLRGRLAGASLIVSSALFSTVLAYAAAPSAPRLAPARIARALGPLHAAVQEALFSPAASLAPIPFDAPAPVERDPMSVFQEEPKANTIEAIRELRTRMTQAYLAKIGQPANLGTGVELNQYVLVLGPDNFAKMDALDNRVAAMLREKERDQALVRGDNQMLKSIEREPVDGPASFVVPEGLSANQAARAVGLNSTLGYATSLTERDLRGRTVYFKCYAPEAPVDLPCSL